MFSIAVLMIGMIINAQDVLTISGQVYTDNNETWLGVNIPRSLPVKLFFINNTITSVNTLGYMLQAGDEVPDDDNNNLDGEIITGNKFIWNGNDMKSITHGLFTGHNKNIVIEYNYLDHVPMGIIRKSGTNMNNTSGGVAYNIVRSPNVGIVIKGMSDVCIYNNTLYQDRNATETDRGLIDVYSNTDVSPISVSHGTRIFNNIFYTKYTTYCIKIIDLESLTGFESDYNVFYSESGSPRFSVGGSVKTFSEWQALGYDVHSVVVNPRFKDFVNFVPVERLDYGTDLGSEWNKGLSIDAVWGNSDPEITIQNGKWQAGARIYGSTIQIPEITGAVIETATPARLDLIFNLAMANIIPVTSSFKVTVNSLPVSLKSLAISGNKALLELSSPVTNGGVVTISYTKPSENPIQSINGGQVASFISKPVINNVESFRPVLVAASVENSSPYTIRMLYDLLLAAVKPSVSAFTVMINSVPESVNKVEISGKEVLLTLEEPVANGDVITVAYTIPSLYALRSASGWYVLSFNAQTVTNNLNSLRPVLVHSSVENNSPDIIELTFNLDLSDILPPASAFNVMVNSIKSSVNKVEVSGTKVFLTLAGNVVTGDVITVSYTIPSVNALRSVAGWYVLSFGAQLVTNNVYSPRPVLISSSVENNAPYNLKLTFSLNLSVGYVPPSSAFMVNVNSVPRVVSSVAISGTDVTLTLSNPIIYGDHITVAYAVSANALRSVPGWYVL